MKTQGGRRKAQRTACRAARSGGRPSFSTQHSAFSTRNSSFIIHHSSFIIPFRRRAGVTLLEVLISMGVLSIGLLGVVALIPMGRFAVVEAGKADRSGACGHAAMREIKVRRMLDPYPWADPNNPQWVLADGNDAVDTAFKAGSFAIDPLGIAYGRTENLGGAGPVTRITLKSPVTGNPLTLAEAEPVFRWRDELAFAFPEDMEPPPSDDSDRPRAIPGASGLPDFQGNYSWLLTVTPAAAEANLPVAERTLYSVSVAVCYKRDFSADGEHTASVADFYGGGWGGGSLRLDSVIEVKRNEWILLCGGRQCKWYRVVSVAPDDGTSPPSLLITLAGPDWDTADSPTPTVVVIDHVVGVYATTVELDSSLLWNK